MKKAVKKLTKQTKIEKNEISELRKLAYIFGSIVIVFLLFYGIAYLKTNKKEVQEEATRNIQYDEILVGNLLKQSGDSYYVFVYNNEETYNGLYNPYITKYKATDNAIPVYYADLNNTFNKGFLAETNQFKINNIVDLKISENVLFLIKDGKITNSYIGEEIIKTLSK